MFRSVYVIRMATSVRMMRKFSTFKPPVEPKFHRISTKIAQGKSLEPEDMALLTTRELCQTALGNMFSHEQRAQLLRTIQPSVLQDANTLEGILKWTKLFRSLQAASSLAVVKKFELKKYIKSARNLCFTIKQFSADTKKNVIDLFTNEEISSLFQTIDDIEELKLIRSGDAVNAILQKLENLNEFIKTDGDLLRLVNTLKSCMISDETDGYIKKIEPSIQAYIAKITTFEQLQSAMALFNFWNTGKVLNFWDYETIQKKCKDIIDSADKLKWFISICGSPPSYVLGKLFKPEDLALICLNANKDQKRSILMTIFAGAEDGKDEKAFKFGCEIADIMKINEEFEEASQNPGRKNRI